MRTTKLKNKKRPCTRCGFCNDSYGRWVPRNPRCTHLGDMDDIFYSVLNLHSVLIANITNWCSLNGTNIDTLFRTQEPPNDILLLVNQYDLDSRIIYSNINE